MSHRINQLSSVVNGQLKSMSWTRKNWSMRCFKFKTSWKAKASEISFPQHRFQEFSDYLYHLRLSSVLSVSDYLSLGFTQSESNHFIYNCYFPILKHSWVKLKNSILKTYWATPPTLSWKGRHFNITMSKDVKHTTRYLWRQIMP